MFRKTMKKIFGILMFLFGIIFLFVPVVPSTPFFILGAIAIGFVTKDYLKRKLSLKKEGLIKDVARVEDGHKKAERDKCS